MFHLGLVAGVTGVVTVGTYIYNLADGKSHDEAVSESIKVIATGINVATMGGSGKKG